MPFQQARHREDVADIVVHHQYPFAMEKRIGLVQLFQHLTLMLRQALFLYAMQEEGGLVEQAFGGTHRRLMMMDCAHLA